MSATQDDAGRYELEGMLGKGAMGVVYRARERASGRRVALKLLETPDAQLRLARFEREGQVTAALRHPGIVRVHATGSLQGKPFLAYELVEDARPLDAAWRDRDLRGRVRLLRDVAAALGYAHARGVVHRDVKPENVLVDGRGRPRVLDFGVAAHASGPRLTQTGAMVGTPAYMSPEQFRGEGIGPPADVWALGVILYEALTGAQPFTGDSIGELLAQVLRGGLRRPRELERTVPAALEGICLRALEATPALRYPHGDAFAAALDDWLEGRVAARAPWSRAAAVATVGVLAVAGGLAAAWATRPAVAGSAVARTTDDRASGADDPPTGAGNRATGAGDPATGRDDPTTGGDDPAVGDLDDPADAPLERLGDVEDAEDLARFASEALDPDQRARVALIVQLAEGGDPGALVRVGHYHRDGKHGFPRDQQRALAYYERAAARGSLDGLLEAAKAYRLGYGTPADAARAAELYEEAATIGSPKAKAWLGVLHEEGQGVPQSDALAATWYRRAGDQSLARRRLAQLVRAGRVEPEPDDLPPAEDDADEEPR